jgi:hypothetical protein
MEKLYYGMKMHYNNKNDHPQHIYSAFFEKPESNWHFLVPGRYCMTHRQALQDFPDTIKVLLYENNKINLPFSKRC